VGVRIGQPSQQHAVGDAEDRGRRADAQAHDEHGQREERRLADEEPCRVSCVAQQLEGIPTHESRQLVQVILREAASRVYRAPARVVEE